MCESRLIIRSNKKDKMVMDGVARILVKGNNICCTNFFGETREFKNVKVTEANFLDHRIFIEEV